MIHPGVNKHRYVETMLCLESLKCLASENSGFGINDKQCFDTDQDSQKNKSKKFTLKLYSGP